MIDTLQASENRQSRLTRAAFASSASDEWATPAEFFAVVEREIGGSTASGKRTKGGDGMMPLATLPAWKLIGWDDGLIRIQGGRTMYESCDGSGGKNVLLQRLDCSGVWPKAVRRWIPSETMIEVMEDLNNRLELLEAA